MIFVCIVLGDRVLSAFFDSSGGGLGLVCGRSRGAWMSGRGISHAGYIEGRGKVVFTLPSLSPLVVPPLVRGPKAPMALREDTSPPWL